MPGDLRESAGGCGCQQPRAGLDQAEHPEKEGCGLVLPQQRSDHPGGLALSEGRSRDRKGCIPRTATKKREEEVVRTSPALEKPGVVVHSWEIKSPGLA